MVGVECMHDEVRFLLAGAEDQEVRLKAIRMSVREVSFSLLRAT